MKRSSVYVIEVFWGKAWYPHFVFIDHDSALAEYQDQCSAFPEEQTRLVAYPQPRDVRPLRVYKGKSVITTKG